MLSLPLIIPRDDHIWFRSTNAATNADPTTTTTTTNGPPSLDQQPPSRRPQSPTRSPLALLAADENTIQQRKLNVRRFGAGWIRPPGVAKTYQATMDELAEREEQEMLARREQAMMELANAQEMEAMRERQGREEGEEGEAGEEGEEEGAGRDLDDGIPEAEDVTFNEDSLLEDSLLEPDPAEVEQMLELEEAEVTGVLQEERDLDDDVPEAGSYQHTDTEAEDTSSEVGEMEGEASVRRTGRQRGGRRLMEEGSSLLAGSSVLGGSSFLQDSSPAAGSGTVGYGNAFRERLVRGGRPGSRG